MDCAEAQNYLGSRLSNTWILDYRTGEFREALYKPGDIEHSIGDRTWTSPGYLRITNPPKSIGDVVGNITVLASLFGGGLTSCGGNPAGEVLFPAWLFQSLVTAGVLAKDPTGLLLQLDPTDKATLISAAVTALRTEDENSDVPTGIAYVVIASPVFDLALWPWFWYWAKGGPNGRAKLRTRVFAMKALQAMVRRGQPFTSAISRDVDALQQSTDDFDTLFPAANANDQQERELYAYEGSALAALVAQVLASRALIPVGASPPRTQILVPGVIPGTVPRGMPGSGSLPPWVLPVGGATLVVAALLGLVALTRRRVVP